MGTIAKYLGLDRIPVIFKTIRCNGGILNSIKVFCVTDDLKYGDLVGEDKFGNKYYQNDGYIFGRNRWVVYSDKVFYNYDASQIPPEWFGWMHFKTDLPPHLDPSRPNYKWMAEHKENLSGTKFAYYPYPTTRPKIEPWTPPQ